MKLNGLSQVLNNIKKAVALAGEATQEGLDAAGLIVESESIDRTPKDTGDLRNTAYREVQGKPLRVGYWPQYAPKLHEDMKAHHEVGEPKFLENAAKAKEQEALAAVGDAIKRALN